MPHPIDYQKANPAQTEMLKMSMGNFKALYDWIEANVPVSRERSLAITNLEQSSMWANKAIAFHFAREDADG